MTVHADMHNVSLVLNRPKYPGNVGSIARCAKNFGIAQMILVGGRELDVDEMLPLSTHCAADIVREIRHCDTLEEALGGFRYIVGTTARRGKARGPLLSPREAAGQLAALAPENEAALLFGPEDAGLSNEDLRFCHAVVRIPTAEDFTSLNLSHAAMILCYEVFVARTGEVPAGPTLATAAELAGMYEQIKTLLVKIGFFKPENPDYWMRHVRRFFSRTRLSSREVKIVRGVCRQLEWWRRQNSA